MSQKKVQQRYRLVSDNDGHDYIIKAGHETEFYKWVEATEDGEETDDFDSLGFDGCRVNRSGWTFTDSQGWE